MKKWFLLIVILSVFLLHHSHKSMKWGGGGIDKVELLELHNEQRGNSSLSMIIELDKAAQLHAEWMAENNDMNHFENNSKKRSVGDRVEKQWKTVGENIAYGQLTPQEVTQDWMRSPGHRANILNKNFHHVGFGIAKAKNNDIYWCAVFSD